MRQRHFLSCHRNPQNKSCCFKGTDVSLNAWSYCLCIGLEIYTLLFYLGQLNFWPLIYLFISNIPLRCYLPWLDHIRSFPITMLPLVNYNKEQWKVCKEINLMIGTFQLGWWKENIFKLHTIIIFMQFQETPWTRSINHTGSLEASG